MASDVMAKPHQLIVSDRVEGTAVRRPNFFFFNDTATPEIYTAQYTLSLHDALPISVAERVPLRRRGEERQRLVQALRVLKACPGDLAVARKTRREPASHRKAERVIERRVRDPGVVEALPRGGPEPHHALGEFRERAIDALEDLGTVGVRLEKAQRLVETDERRRPREGAALERVEQAELLLPRRGIVAGGDGGEGIHEPPGP